MQNGKTIHEISIGDTAKFEKTISETDSYLYTGITGDFNPIHISRRYAENTPFKARIVHGFLTAGFISTILGTTLPGPGTIYAKQDLKFLKPVMVGDTVCAKVTVIEKNEEKNQLILLTECFNQNDDLVLTGKATVLPPVSNEGV